MTIIKYRKVSSQTKKIIGSSTKYHDLGIARVTAFE